MNELAKGLRALGYSEFAVRGDRIELKQGVLNHTVEEIRTAGRQYIADVEAANAAAEALEVARTEALDALLVREGQSPGAAQALRDFAALRRG